MWNESRVAWNRPTRRFSTDSRGFMSFLAPNLRRTILNQAMDAARSVHMNADLYLSEIHR